MAWGLIIVLFLSLGPCYASDPPIVPDFFRRFSLRIIEKNGEEYFIPKGQKSGGTYLHQLVLENNIEQIHRILRSKISHLFPSVIWGGIEETYGKHNGKWIEKWHSKWKRVRPFHLAIYLGRNEIFALFWKYHPKKCMEHDENGYGALHYAAQEGQVEIVRFLLGLQMPEFTQPNIGAWNALHFAARGGHEEIVKILLKTKNPIFLEKNFCRSGPLLLAAQRGHTKVVQRLLESKISDFLLPDSNGNTALFWAIKFGHPDTVKLLLDSQIPEFLSPNYFGETILQVAFSHPDDFIKAQFILEILDSDMPLSLPPFQDKNDPVFLKKICLFLLASHLKITDKKKVIGYILRHSSQVKISVEDLTPHFRYGEMREILEIKTMPKWSIKNHAYYPKKVRQAIEELFFIFRLYNFKNLSPYSFFIKDIQFLIFQKIAEDSLKEYLY